MLRHCARLSIPLCSYRMKILTRNCTNKTKHEADHAKEVGSIIKHWSRKFEDEGINEPVSSIEHILAHVVGTTKIMDLAISYDRKLTEEQMNKLEKLCECRLSRMPVQYIIGEWDFRDLTLKLVPPVFIPRPETELLVDFIIKRLNSESLNEYKILEIGCGSGAISLALLHTCKKVKMVAIDRNVLACHLTRENASNLKLLDRITIVNASIDENGTVKNSSNETRLNLNDEVFDFIVSNPPYIPTKSIMKLAPEIKVYEDIRALDGGPDGLNVIKAIMKYSSNALRSGGRLFLEVDSSHPEYVNYFTTKYPNYKLKHDHTYKDYCNNERFVEILKI
ncbi:MTRF1L release factor glutamine methyltransferase [Venturia canescens]|uniref:MTRF1L release factor glutamine methyltransferase n=1 Tax=Venturia canescens TaxID=32260 RepID=UPI001C9BF2C3|nr:MTRF1L release factor glutamine methyltransferase [Venturia canescens]